MTEHKDPRELAGNEKNLPGTDPAVREYGSSAALGPAGDGSKGGGFEKAALEKAAGKGTAGEKTAAELDRSGVSLKTMNLIFGVIAILTAALLFVTASMIDRGYSRMEDASDRYILARQAAADMQAGSDYLTDRVRCFVVTGEMNYLEDFRTETGVTKRRDNALASLEKLLEGGTGNRAYESLAIALNFSNELLQREYRAMRLELSSQGDALLKDDAVPQEVRDIQLPAEDLALSPADRHERAKELVFDDVYMSFKDKISFHVNRCTQTLIQESSQELERANAYMNRLLRVQSVLTVVMLLIVLFLILFISTQVIRPLAETAAKMRLQEMAEPSGAEEMRFVANTYNEILVANRRQKDQLTYEAMHDALTGVYNRSAYDMFLKDSDLAHGALMIVDVDKFKGVNDTYGHDIGDRVLKRVAGILRRSFRSVDIVCRIGGDEFAVIITRVNHAMAKSITTKIDEANRILMDPQDDLPPVKLSAGIAFHDRPDPRGDLFKDADTALYRQKAEGNGGCRVYGS